MKRISVISRRHSSMFWVAMLTVCLLLSGASTFETAAAAPLPAPALPVTDQRVVGPAAPAAPAAPDDAVEPGLWGWWKLDQIDTTTTSPTTPDGSMYNHAGWLGDDGGNDQPSLSTSHAPTVMTNTGSFYFNGSSDWISFHTGPDVSSDDDFTMAAWIYWNGQKSAIFYQGQTADNHGLHLAIDLDNPVIHPQVFTLKCGFWGNDLTYKPGNGSLFKNWHHVACVCDHTNGHARKLYVDGVQVASDTPTNWYVGSGDLWMGRKLPDIAQWDFNGYIDEARFYTRALTAAEIEGLAARSTTENLCFAQPVDSSGNTNGTISASTDATAVQAVVDTLGAAGGTVRISGTCTGVTVRDDIPQTVGIPALNTGATLTLEGGWPSDFSARDASTNPTTLDANGAGRVVFAPGSTGSLALSDLTLTNGDSSALPNVPNPPLGGQTEGGSGGALRTSIPTTLTNVSVINSIGGYSGGGISVRVVDDDRLHRLGQRDRGI